ncbi:MAG: acyl carrier protein [Candidatus Omnitrophota bacterium]|jgi:acyl carrier protein
MDCQNENLKTSLKKFIMDTFMFGEGQLDYDTPLFESGIIDSMGFIKLLAFLEKDCGVSLDMSEITMENFRTINNICEKINSKQNKLIR